LASQEKWCWKLYCTTCGHAHFRYALREIANGKTPEDQDWIIHINRTNYNELGSFPFTYSPNECESIAEICSGANISGIKNKCIFPDWLGYLGLVLFHIKDNDLALSVISKSWSKQLLDFLPINTDIYSKLNMNLQVDSFLTIEDLEEIESALVFFN